MKKYLLGLTALMLAFAACSDGGDEISPEEKQTADEVKVYFVYTLETSNGSSMTRANTNAEVFDDFYQEICVGELAAPTYELTLSEINTGETYTFNGKWKSHDVVAIRKGTYQVVGKSSADGETIQEKCSFTFDEQIEISMQSNIITLHPKYDCALLAFNDSEIQSLVNFDGINNTPFFSFSTYKYVFTRGNLYITEKKEEAYILGKYADGTEFKIFTGKINFEIGKYYVYDNNVTTVFSVPLMEEGWETSNPEDIEGFGRVAEAIDLGLSVKWASWNLGASSVADYGERYAMGDPTGLLTSTSYLDYYFKDGESICGTEYDIAKVKWKGNWRLPTYEEVVELRDNCSWSHNETLDGIKGSYATGPNGNSIFIPYAGVRSGNTIMFKNNNASIWTGDMGTTEHSYGYKDLDVFYNGTFRVDGCENYVGQTVRPVCD